MTRIAVDRKINEIALSVHDVNGPMSNAPEKAGRAPAASPAASTSGSVQRAIACLLFLIVVLLTVLVGLAVHVVISIKPSQTADALVTLSELVPIAREIQPSISTLAAAVNSSSMLFSSFAEYVRHWGPPKSIPLLLASAMTVHLGDVTAELARIGSKLEPLLEKLRYDDTFVDPATFVANFFQAIRQLDGPIHKAEVDVFGNSTTDGASNGDIVQTLREWLGEEPVEYLVSQLDGQAWNSTTAACHSLRREMSIVMTELSIEHAPMQMISPIYVSSYYDKDGVYHPGFYTLVAPPPSPSSPASPPSTSCSSFCTSVSIQYKCSPDGYASSCAGCSDCVDYLKNHAQPSYEGDTYDGPSPDEGPLEAGLRNAYDSLAYVCLIFEAMAE